MSWKPPKPPLPGEPIKISWNKIRRLLGWLGLPGDDGLNNWERRAEAEQYLRQVSQWSPEQMDSIKERMRQRWREEHPE